MIRDIEFKNEEGIEVKKPFLFSYRAIKEVNKAGIADSLEQLEKAAYLGFYYGHIKRNGNEPAFTQETIAEWFEDDLSLIGKVTEVITEVMGEFESSTVGKKNLKVK